MTGFSNDSLAVVTRTLLAGGLPPMKTMKILNPVAPTSVLMYDGAISPASLSPRTQIPDPDNYECPSGSSLKEVLNDP